MDAWNEERTEHVEALLWAAWHNALLQRVKDFPTLDKVLGREPAPQDKRDLAEKLKAALMSVRPTGRGGPPGDTPEPAPAATAAE